MHAEVDGHATPARYGGYLPMELAGSGASAAVQVPLNPVSMSPW